MAGELRASLYNLSLELPDPEQLLSPIILDQFAFFPSPPAKICLKSGAALPRRRKVLISSNKLSKPIKSLPYPTSHDWKSTEDVETLRYLLSTTCKRPKPTTLSIHLPADMYKSKDRPPLYALPLLILYSPLAIHRIYDCPFNRLLVSNGLRPWSSSMPIAKPSAKNITISL